MTSILQYSASFGEKIDVSGLTADLWSPDITALAGGRTAVVWTEDKNAGIWLRLFDENDMPEGSAVRVTAPEERANRPAVAQLENGEIVVTYTSLAGGVFAPIAHRKFGPDGTPTGASNLLVDSESHSFLGPETLALSGGGSLTVFTATGSLDGDSFGVFGQFADVSGAPVGPTFQINQTTEDFQSFGDLTELDDGTIVVTWRSKNVDGSFYAVMARHYDSSGNPLGDEFRVNQYSWMSQQNPDVTALSNGTYVVTWESSGQDGSGDGVYARLFNVDGTPIGNEFRINTTLANDQNSSSVAAKPDGGFVVVWMHEVFSDTTEIRMQEYNAAGERVGVESILADSPTGVHTAPKIVIGDDGAGRLIWFQTVQNSGVSTVFLSVTGLQLKGTTNNDLLAGTARNDGLSGLFGDDELLGEGGDDRLLGGQGTDTLDGGSGIDTAIYSGHQNAYTLTQSPSGLSLTDRRLDGEGTDTLVGLEFLDFSSNIFGGAFDLQKFGGTVALDPGLFSEIIQLYIAYFNRAPDAIGLNFWATEYAEGGLSLEQMAAYFNDQDETRSTYPTTLTNGEFVTAIYGNVLGRAPDQEGFDFWVPILDAGSLGRETFILAILEGAKRSPTPDDSAELVANLAADKQYLSNKVDIGAYFAVHKGMSDTANASSAMSLFDGTQAGIEAAVDAIDTFALAALDADSGEFLMPLVGVLDDPFMG